MTNHEIFYNFFCFFSHPTTQQYTQTSYVNMQAKRRGAALVRKYGEELFEIVRSAPQHCYGTGNSHSEDHGPDSNNDSNHTTEDTAALLARWDVAAHNLARSQPGTLLDLSNTQVVLAMHLSGVLPTPQQLPRKMAWVAFERSAQLGPQCALLFASFARSHVAPPTLMARLVEVILLPDNIATLCIARIAAMLSSAVSLGTVYREDALFPLLLEEVVKMHIPPQDLRHLAVVATAAAGQFLQGNLVERFVRFLGRSFDVHSTPEGLSRSARMQYIRDVLTFTKHNHLPSECLLCVYNSVLRLLALDPPLLSMLPLASQRTVLHHIARSCTASLAVRLAIVLAPTLTDYPALGEVGGHPTEAAATKLAVQVATLPFFVLLKGCSEAAWVALLEEIAEGGVHLGLSWLVLGELCASIGTRCAMLRNYASVGPVFSFLSDHLTSLPIRYGVAYAAGIEGVRASQTTPHPPLPGLIHRHFFRSPAGAWMTQSPAASGVLLRIAWRGVDDAGNLCAKDAHCAAVLRVMRRTAQYDVVELVDMTELCTTVTHAGEVGLHTTALLLICLAECRLIPALARFSAVVVQRAHRNLHLGGLPLASFNTTQLLDMSAALIGVHEDVLLATFLGLIRHRLHEVQGKGKMGVEDGPFLAFCRVFFPYVRHRMDNGSHSGVLLATLKGATKHLAFLLLAKGSSSSSSSSAALTTTTVLPYLPAHLHSLLPVSSLLHFSKRGKLHPSFPLGRFLHALDAEGWGEAEGEGEAPRICITSIYRNGVVLLWPGFAQKALLGSMQSTIGRMVGRDVVVSIKDGEEEEEEVCVSWGKGAWGSLDAYVVPDVALLVRACERYLVEVVPESNTPYAHFAAVCNGDSLDDLMCAGFAGWLPLQLALLCAVQNPSENDVAAAVYRMVEGGGGGGDCVSEEYAPIHTHLLERAPQEYLECMLVSVA